MGKRAQRIPSWPGVIHSNKGRIHLRRPTCDILTFRLRRGGGPYIPVCPSSDRVNVWRLSVGDPATLIHLGRPHSAANLLSHLSRFYESVSETVPAGWPLFPADLLKRNNHFRAPKTG